MSLLLWHLCWSLRCSLQFLSPPARAQWAVLYARPRDCLPPGVPLPTVVGRISCSPPRDGRRHPRDRATTWERGKPHADLPSKHSTAENAEKQTTWTQLPLWGRFRRQDCKYRNGSTEFSCIFIKCSGFEDGKTRISTSNTQRLQWFTFSSLFIPGNCPYCRFFMDEIWNWADFPFFFSTKLWYKLARFSILLLINLTGAQFVK